MRYETPYIGPIELFRGYDPQREIGDVVPATTTTYPDPLACERPWWWLVAAAAAGGFAGFALTKKDKRRRRGRIE